MDLEKCWYISPPWEKVPQAIATFGQKIYVPNVNIFGYCCGYQWEDERLNYAINTDAGKFYLSEKEMLPVHRFAEIAVKPLFELGDLVQFQFAKEPGIRLILGVQLINETWFYTIEWESPRLAKDDNSLAWVAEDDLVKIAA